MTIHWCVDLQLQQVSTSTNLACSVYRLETGKRGFEFCFFFYLLKGNTLIPATEMSSNPKNEKRKKKEFSSHERVGTQSNQRSVSQYKHSCEASLPWHHWCFAHLHKCLTLLFLWRPECRTMIQNEREEREIYIRTKQKKKKKKTADGSVFCEFILWHWWIFIIIFTILLVVRHARHKSELVSWRRPFLLCQNDRLINHSYLCWRRLSSDHWNETPDCLFLRSF